MDSVGGFLKAILASPSKRAAPATPSVSTDSTDAGPSSLSPTMSSLRVQKSRKSKISTSVRSDKQRADRLATHLRSNSPLQEIVNDKPSASRRRSAPAKPATIPRQRINARRGRHSTIVQGSSTLVHQEEKDDASRDGDTVFASQPPNVPLTSLDSQPTDEKEVLVENPQKSSLNEEQIEAGNIAVTTNLTVSRVARDPVHDDDDAADDAEDDTETAKDTDEEMFTFTNLLAHRWSGDEIEMEVDWHGSEPTWELEMNLHRDAPDALFAYWRAQGGRPENPRDPGLYDIFAIRKHSRNRLRLLVEWTGYPPEDNTWESRKMLEETAPEVLAEYWESVKPTLKRGPKK